MGKMTAGDKVENTREESWSEEGDGARAAQESGRDGWEGWREWGEMEGGGARPDFSSGGEWLFDREGEVTHTHREYIYHTAH